MSTEEGRNTAGELKSYEENPFGKGAVTTEDLVRYFYLYNVPVLPVISKRDIVIGCLFKEDLVAELSDIERSRKDSIDQFITRVARKATFDDLLPHGKIKLFKTINIFGELQEDWTRAQLFGSLDGIKPSSHEPSPQDGGGQEIEWMIYMILEHLPRALYALNKKGNTIFYNSHFESLYEKALGKEVDHKHVEKSLRSTSLNEPAGGTKEKEIIFYNKELHHWYEKIPMKHEGKIAGHLIYFHNDSDRQGDIRIAGLSSMDMDLATLLAAVEKESLRMALEEEDQDKAAQTLGLSRDAFRARVKKFSLKASESKKKPPSGKKGKG